jgi:hypothetical protein
MSLLMFTLVKTLSHLSSCAQISSRRVDAWEKCGWFLFNDAKNLNKSKAEEVGE